MALDLTGIENVEFYSGHYLDAVLEGDLKGLFETWRKAEDEDGRKAPYKRFNAVVTAWEQARKQAGGEPEALERWRVARGFHAQLIEALGYRYEPDVAHLEDDTLIPLATRVDRDGHPYLWVVDAPFPADESSEALDAPLLREQYPASGEGEGAPAIPQSRDNGQKGAAATWRELLDTALFRLDHAPRWILFLGGDEILLAERAKWPAGRFLRFDLGALFTRRDPKALRALCALIHRDALDPDAGLCLHDTLEENSHKHAFAVSGDLKHGVRRAVELLANEAVWYRREKQHKGVFNEEELAASLQDDCLVWLYRLLFLFYVEARGGELGVVPMKSDVYREGYSLEKLRELELVPLTTEKAREGYYLDQSLKLLFRIVNEGFPDETSFQGRLGMGIDAMRLPALRSPLFDDERLKVFGGVRFRNHVLQEVLQLLSLSGEKKRKARGRISYAQLGINQLGAVYEGLLSYTGFFATEDLYEVASEKDCTQLSGKPAAEREALKTYFVPASRIGDYHEGEIVKDDNERKVVHKKGTFIFRLAGRNREKSASYYTPEVLTQCLVKYALKELLWKEGPDGLNAGEKPRRKKTADEILALTICEPAMGSSAFLIEAVDQLADAYLEARQDEVVERGGDPIPPEDYQREKRRVKARLATNNCYGVDLNPTAVELAKVSLWLATLHEDGKCPWFGLRLAVGNSLVGARREVFETADVTRKGTKDNPNWLGLVPEPVSLHHGSSAGDEDWDHWTTPHRPKGTIYHFLLPAEGMAAFDKDKVIKQLAPESVKRIKEWRKEFCKPFGTKDAERLEQISDAVDRLFAQVVRERVLATQETSDRIPVWGEPRSDDWSAKQARLLVRDQEEVAASLEDGSSAYRRLKLAMDAWCALWFWPIEEAGLLPDRATWLAQIELILKGQVTCEQDWQQQSLFAALLPGSEGDLQPIQRVSPDVRSPDEATAGRLMRLRALSDAFRQRRADYLDDCGLADVAVVVRDVAQLAIAKRLSDELKFHHWDLRFAEAFALAGGFDLTLGNPPWIKLQWNEAAFFSDYEPSCEIRGMNATEIGKRREAIIERFHAHPDYLSDFAELGGTQSFLSADENFAALSGVQPNLYKCFIARSWAIGSAKGIVGFVHPEGIYDDPNGGALRMGAYRRLRSHFQFRNVLPLFEGLNDHGVLRFSLNVYHSREAKLPGFDTFANLYHPKTIDASFSHDGRGNVPGIKDSAGNWCIEPHARRIVRVDNRVLALISELYEEKDAPALEARLPSIHSEEIVNVAQKLSEISGRVGDHQDSLFATRMFEETASEREGLIRRETQFPGSVEEWILQGPHFYVGTPLNKTPDEICESRGAYTRIDLAHVAENYLPRTNYFPADQSRLKAKIPSWKRQPVTAFYRIALRKRIVASNERTLIACIIPPGLIHIYTCICVAMESADVVRNSFLFQSIPYDFIVKMTGKADLNMDIAEKLPSPELGLLEPWGAARTLLLNCLNSDYSPLWSSEFREVMRDDHFAKDDRRLRNFSHLRSEWDLSVPLRSDYERRQALLENDVLAALGLGLAFDELTTIYCVQFPVLQQYDREHLFAQSGAIVPTSKTAAGNRAVSLVELATTLKEQAGFDVHAGYHPDGSNTQELRAQKIRLGKKEADVLGVSERCTMADLLAETEVRWSNDDHPEGRPVRLVGLRYTDPGLEPRMERVYPTPWTRCDREADYRQAWAEFERRLGKRMPEGTPL